MDEPENSAERRARQFADLRKLGSKAMELVEAYATQALADIKTPDKPSTAAAALARMAGIVQHLIALELRVEAGPPRSAAAAKDLGPAPPPDPRRPLLQQVLYDAVREHADRARQKALIDKHIDQELQADPHDEVPIEEILETICRELGITFDPARISDEFLDYGEPVKIADFRNRNRDASS